MKSKLRATIVKILLALFCLSCFIVLCFIPVKKSEAVPANNNYLIKCFSPGRDAVKPAYEFESPMFKAMPNNYMLFIKEGKNFATNLPCIIEVQ